MRRRPSGVFDAPQPQVVPGRRAGGRAALPPEGPALAGWRWRGSRERGPRLAFGGELWNNICNFIVPG